MHGIVQGNFEARSSYPIQPKPICLNVKHILMVAATLVIWDSTKLAIVLLYLLEGGKPLLGP